MKKLKDFTLIELLVVIAVIAILMSVLLPSLNMAKEKVRALNCLSNMRQANIAMVGYATDSNEYLPVATLNVYRVEDFVCAFIPYYGYTLSSAVSAARTRTLSKYLTCQSDNLSLSASQGNGPVITSYAFTMTDTDPSPTPAVWAGSGTNAWGGRKRLTQITDNSVTFTEKYIACFETDSSILGYRCEPQTWRTSITYYWLNGTTAHRNYTPSFIHNRSSAFLFLDGHARMVKIGAINPFNTSWQLN